VRTEGELLDLRCLRHSGGVFVKIWSLLGFGREAAAVAWDAEVDGVHLNAQNKLVANKVNNFHTIF
jgi:hypothetical protein